MLLHRKPAINSHATEKSKKSPTQVRAHTLHESKGMHWDRDNNFDSLHWLASIDVRYKPPTNQTTYKARNKATAMKTYYRNKDHKPTPE